MKQALISPNESVESGYRVAEVVDQLFEVAPPLFFVECADDVVADQFYYDTNFNALMPVTQVVSTP